MIHPTRAESFTTIVAMSDQGINFTKTKNGTNKAEDFVSFLEDLIHHLNDKYSGEIDDIVIIFDGATIHGALDTRKVIEEEGFKALMLSSHSPGESAKSINFLSISSELNAAEHYIREHKKMLRSQLSREM